MKILQVISSIDPKYGGPIEGVNQLSAVCRGFSIEVEICSLDMPNAECVANSKIKIHALGPALGKYAYSSRMVPWLQANAHEYDAVIVNGLWQYVGFAVWRALAATNTPYFVFTHGMLGPWFKHTYPLKHLKKWLYWPWAEYRVLRDARAVLFTCEEERRLARQSFWLYRAKEAVTGFGSASPPGNCNELTRQFLLTHSHLQGKRIIIFLGRLHEVKGCDLLLGAFARVAKADKRLHLLMAGPDNTDLAASLKTQAERLCINQRITWSGALHGPTKWGAINAAEVFCLPSHHENFGVVVAEALACGKPVLISNKVNIWREIEDDSAGFVDEDTVDGTVRNLQRWLALDVNGYAEMSDQARKCFGSRFQVQRAAERLMEIIREHVH